MIIKFLAALDILVGVFILLKPEIFLVKILIYMILVKGIFSIISNIATGFYFDIMGILDILAGLCLIGVFNGWSFFVFPVIGVLMIVKGVISLI